MKIHKLIIIFIGLGLIFSCSKDDDSQQPTIQEPVKITNIYVGGSQKINGLEKATIWKNGVVQLLTTNLTNASRINSIYVYNDVVYAVGFEVVANANIATLWIDGVKTALVQGFSEAYSVSVKLNTVYIVGQINGKATLWTTTTTGLYGANELSSTTGSIAKSIFITDDGNAVNGIYIAGKIGANAWTFINSNNTVATNTSVAESIFVRGTDVFVVINNEFLNIKTASLQKNGIPQNTIAGNTVMYSVYGDDQNIFAVGATNPNNPVSSRATIWENNIPRQLSQLFSQANSVFVADKKVYVAGFEYDSDTAHYKATLWINGKVQTLSTEDCQTKSVFVTVK